MKTQTQYRPLLVGEIRQEGDETRHKYGAGPDATVHPNDRRGDWRPVSLIGHSILPADLIVGEFRRAI